MTTKTPNNDQNPTPTPKSKKSLKTKAIQKPAEDLVLTKTIHIGGVTKFKDGVEHITGGAHYPAGTVVTEEMAENYEIIREKIGGTTPITKFCE